MRPTNLLTISRTIILLFSFTIKFISPQKTTENPNIGDVFLDRKPKLPSIQKLTVNIGEIIDLKCVVPTVPYPERNSKLEKVIESSNTNRNQNPNQKNPSQNFIWDYSKTLKAYQNKDTNVIVIYNEIDLNKKDIIHLKGQVSVSVDLDDAAASSSSVPNIRLKPKNINSSGIYICRDPTPRGEIFNIIEVEVISVPKNLEINEFEGEEPTRYILGQQANFNCIAKNAYPSPNLKFYVGDELVSESAPIRKNDQDPSTKLFTNQINVSKFINTTTKNFQHLIVKCVAEHPAWYKPVVEKLLINLEFKPIIAEIGVVKYPNFEPPANTNLELKCDFISNPVAEMTWLGLEKIDRQFYNLTETTENPESNSMTNAKNTLTSSTTLTLINFFKNKNIFANTKNTNYNNLTIGCSARNIHGNDENFINLSDMFIKLLKRQTAIAAMTENDGIIGTDSNKPRGRFFLNSNLKAQITEMISSNTILVIGIIIAIVILSLIGLTVILRRRRHGSTYITNEGNYDAGPEGVDYEQNPMREALTAEERETEKELLM